MSHWSPLKSLTGGQIWKAPTDELITVGHIPNKAYLRGFYQNKCSTFHLSFSLGFQSLSLHEAEWTPMFQTHHDYHDLQTHLNMDRYIRISQTILLTRLSKPPNYLTGARPFKWRSVKRRKRDRSETSAFNIVSPQAILTILSIPSSSYAQFSYLDFTNNVNFTNIFTLYKTRAFFARTRKCENIGRQVLLLTSFRLSRA